MLDRLKVLLRAELLQSKNNGKLSFSEQTVVARQPVFDLAGNIWGYELLYRRPGYPEKAEITSNAVATASVIINGFEMVRPGIRNSQKILINFTSEMLEAQVIRLLPPDMCVVEILESVQPTSEVIAALKDLKTAGYTLALDDYTGRENQLPFLELADIVKVDVLGLSEKELTSCTMRARCHKGVLLAEKVEDTQTAALCRSLGFKLFQGFFFSRPEVLKGEKVTTSQAMRMRILALCVSDNVDLKAISDAVLHDPVITANLLKFVNSAYFGLRVRIRSVHHALALVGSVTFMQWLCVSVLATLDNSPIAHELAFLASQRGKFLESLGTELYARHLLPQNITTSSLFLTGLFSLLENVLGMPFADILDGVPLEPAVFTTLTGGTSLYTPWYEIMGHYERGEWNECFSLARPLHLTERDLSASYAKAIEWNATFFGRIDQVDERAIRKHFLR